jgi:hypothetical protein
MAYSSIAQRFEDDLEHLVWRSEVHCLSSGEINLYFTHLRNSYIKLAGDGDRHELQEAISHWSTVIAKTAARHRLYPSTGMKPRS